MSLDKLITLAHSAPTGEEWSHAAKTAFDALYGASSGRYPMSAKSDVQLRAPAMKEDSGISFAALIHPANPTSGPYGGMSFVLFPQQGRCLIGLVVGTQGLSPDEEVLGRPGHARKAAAICRWLNQKHGRGQVVAWAKQDPTRTDQDMPKEVAERLSHWQAAVKRYGKELYAVYAPTEDQDATREAISAFLDLTFRERGHRPLLDAQKDADRIESEWMRHLLPDLSELDVHDLLKRRRYVILEGPPGTGKTRMATRLLETEYQGRGRSIQFHPNTTYESFVGGLAPDLTDKGMGFQFRPRPGALMQAAVEARRHPEKNYLLHIDEINRADLAKVLGEAIFLLEPDTALRSVELPYTFDALDGSSFSLPPNLHILGTMNSSDRSIAIVDVAVRRRFAFARLWPQAGVVDKHAGSVMQAEFRRLLSIFVEHASDDAFDLLPGHAYFLEPDATALRRLQVTLVPLLREYLAQGYVAGFAHEVRAFLQRLESIA